MSYRTLVCLVTPHISSKEPTSLRRDTEISLLNRNELTRLLELWTRSRVRHAVDDLGHRFVILCNPRSLFKCHVQRPNATRSCQNSSEDHLLHPNHSGLKNSSAPQIWMLDKPSSTVSRSRPILVLSVRKTRQRPYSRRYNVNHL